MEEGVTDVTGVSRPCHGAVAHLLLLVVEERKVGVEETVGEQVDEPHLERVCSECVTGVTGVTSVTGVHRAWQRMASVWHACGTRDKCIKSDVPGYSSRM